MCGMHETEQRKKETPSTPRHHTCERVKKVPGRSTGRQDGGSLKVDTELNPERLDKASAR